MECPVKKLGHLEKIRKNWQCPGLNRGPPGHEDVDLQCLQCSHMTEKIVYKGENNAKNLRSDQTAMTTNDCLHVTCTHHLGIIPVTSQRREVPERVGTLDNGSTMTCA